jgi:hypothetical protein
MRSFLIEVEATFHTAAELEPDDRHLQPFSGDAAGRSKFTSVLGTVSSQGVVNRLGIPEQAHGEIDRHLTDDLRATDNFPSFE